MITPFGSEEVIHHSTNEGAGPTSVCAECENMVILDKSDRDLRSCRDCAVVIQKSIERSFPQDEADDSLGSAEENSTFKENAALPAEIFQSSSALHDEGKAMSGETAEGDSHTVMIGKNLLATQGQGEISAEGHQVLMCDSISAAQKQDHLCVEKTTAMSGHFSVALTDVVNIWKGLQACSDSACPHFSSRDYAFTEVMSMRRGIDAAVRERISSVQKQRETELRKAQKEMVRLRTAHEAAVKDKEQMGEEILQVRAVCDEAVKDRDMFKVQLSGAKAEHKAAVENRARLAQELLDLLYAITVQHDVTMSERDKLEQEFLDISRVSSGHDAAVKDRARLEQVLLDMSRASSGNNVSATEKRMLQKDVSTASRMTSGRDAAWENEGTLEHELSDISRARMAEQESDLKVSMNIEKDLLDIPRVHDEAVRVCHELEKYVTEISAMGRTGRDSCSEDGDVLQMELLDISCASVGLNSVGHVLLEEERRDLAVVRVLDAVSEREWLDNKIETSHAEVCEVPCLRKRLMELQSQGIESLQKEIERLHTKIESIPNLLERLTELGLQAERVKVSLLNRQEQVEFVRAVLLGQEEEVKRFEVALLEREKEIKTISKQQEEDRSKVMREGEARVRVDKFQKDWNLSESVNVITEEHVGAPVAVGSVFAEWNECEGELGPLREKLVSVCENIADTITEMGIVNQRRVGEHTGVSVSELEEQGNNLENELVGGEIDRKTDVCVTDLDVNYTGLKRLLIKEGSFLSESTDALQCVLRESREVTEKAVGELKGIEGTLKGEKEKSQSKEEARRMSVEEIKALKARLQQEKSHKEAWRMSVEEIKVLKARLQQEESHKEAWQMSVEEIKVLKARLQQEEKEKERLYVLNESKGCRRKVDSAKKEVCDMRGQSAVLRTTCAGLEKDFTKCVHEGTRLKSALLALQMTVAVADTDRKNLSGLLCKKEGELANVVEEERGLKLELAEMRDELTSSIVWFAEELVMIRVQLGNAQNEAERLRGHCIITEKNLSYQDMETLDLKSRDEWLRSGLVGQYNTLERANFNLECREEQIVSARQAMDLLERGIVRDTVREREQALCVNFTLDGETGRRAPDLLAMRSGIDGLRGEVFFSGQMNVEARIDCGVRARILESISSTRAELGHKFAPAEEKSDAVQSERESSKKITESMHEKCVSRKECLRNSLGRLDNFRSDSQLVHEDKNVFHKQAEQKMLLCRKELAVSDARETLHRQRDCIDKSSSCLMFLDLEKVCFDMHSSKGVGMVLEGIVENLWDTAIVYDGSSGNMIKKTGKAEIVMKGIKALDPSLAQTGKNICGRRKGGEKDVAVKDAHALRAEKGGLEAFVEERGGERDVAVEDVNLPDSSNSFVFLYLNELDAERGLIFSLLQLLRMFHNDFSRESDAQALLLPKTNDLIADRSGSFECMQKDFEMGHDAGARDIQALIGECQRQQAQTRPSEGHHELVGTEKQSQFLEKEFSRIQRGKDSARSDKEVLNGSVQKLKVEGAGSGERNVSKRDWEMLGGKVQASKEKVRDLQSVLSVRVGFCSDRDCESLVGKGESLTVQVSSLMVAMRMIEGERDAGREYEKTLIHESVSSKEECCRLTCSIGETWGADAKDSVEREALIVQVAILKQEVDRVQEESDAVNQDLQRVGTQREQIQEDGKERVETLQVMCDALDQDTESTKEIVCSRQSFLETEKESGEIAGMDCKILKLCVMRLQDERAGKESILETETDTETDTDTGRKVGDEYEAGRQKPVGPKLDLKESSFVSEGLRGLTIRLKRTREEYDARATVQQIDILEQALANMEIWIGLEHGITLRHGLEDLRNEQSCINKEDVLVDEEKEGTGFGDEEIHEGDAKEFVRWMRSMRSSGDVGGGGEREGNVFRQEVGANGKKEDLLRNVSRDELGLLLLAVQCLENVVEQTGVCSLRGSCSSEDTPCSVSVRGTPCSVSVRGFAEGMLSARDSQISQDDFVLCHDNFSCGVSVSSCTVDDELCAVFGHGDDEQHVHKDDRYCCVDDIDHCDDDKEDDGQDACITSQEEKINTSSEKSFQAFEGDFSTATTLFSRTPVHGGKPISPISEADSSVTRSMRRPCNGRAMRVGRSLFAEDLEASPVQNGDAGQGCASAERINFGRKVALACWVLNTTRRGRALRMACQIIAADRRLQRRPLMSIENDSVIHLGNLREDYLQRIRPTCGSHFQASMRLGDLDGCGTVKFWGIVAAVALVFSGFGR